MRVLQVPSLTIVLALLFCTNDGSSSIESNNCTGITFCQNEGNSSNQNIASSGISSCFNTGTSTTQMAACNSLSQFENTGTDTTVLANSASEPCVMLLIRLPHVRKVVRHSCIQ